MPDWFGSVSRQYQLSNYQHQQQYYQQQLMQDGMGGGVGGLPGYVIKTNYNTYDSIFPPQPIKMPVIKKTIQEELQEETNLWLKEVI